MDRKYLTESIDKASSESGFSVSGGYGGAEGSLGANWSSQSETGRKFQWAIAKRGYERVPPGESSCFRVDGTSKMLAAEVFVSVVNIDSGILVANGKSTHYQVACDMNKHNGYDFVSTFNFWYV